MSTPTYIYCEQYSLEWYENRLGKVSASRIADVLANTGIASKREPSRSSSAYSAGRRNYIIELVSERMSGVPYDSGVSTPAMERGSETESRAAAFYERKYGVTLETVGLVIHPTIADGCASPDRLVGNDGLVEIKCPNTSTHAATLLGAPIDSGYLKQMHWQMACTGRKWVDYVSFDDRLSPFEPVYHMRVQRVHRDPILIAEIEREVRAFLGEVESTFAALKQYGADQAAA